MTEQKGVSFEHDPDVEVKVDVVKSRMVQTLSSEVLLRSRLLENSHDLEKVPYHPEHVVEIRKEISQAWTEIFMHNSIEARLQSLEEEQKAEKRQELLQALDRVQKKMSEAEISFMPENYQDFDYGIMGITSQLGLAYLYEWPPDQQEVATGYILLHALAAHGVLPQDRLHDCDIEWVPGYIWIGKEGDGMPIPEKLPTAVDSPLVKLFGLNTFADLAEHIGKIRGESAQEALQSLTPYLEVVGRLQASLDAGISLKIVEYKDTAIDTTALQAVKTDFLLSLNPNIPVGHLETFPDTYQQMDFLGYNQLTGEHFKVANEADKRFIPLIEKVENNLLNSENSRLLNEQQNTDIELALLSKRIEMGNILLNSENPESIIKNILEAWGEIYDIQKKYEEKFREERMYPESKQKFESSEEVRAYREAEANSNSLVHRVELAKIKAQRWKKVPVVSAIVNRRFQSLSEKLQKEGQKKKASKEKYQALYNSLMEKQSKTDSQKVEAIKERMVIPGISVREVFKAYQELYGGPDSYHFMFLISESVIRSIQNDDQEAREQNLAIKDKIEESLNLIGDKLHN